MQEKHALYDMLAPTIEAMGFEVVRILMTGAQRPTLQIMIERQDRKNLVVDDCAAVSRAISAILDEKDPIDSEYSLEVSSPGIDRPLTKPEHFSRFAGYEAKVETSDTVDGRKRFKGKIISLEPNNNIKIMMDDKEYSIPFESVSKAKLVLTDELWNEYVANAQESE
ncbi:MAG: ribosome maturation factor RimP [Alphaproteobacteria bacterium]|nr:ribosome maturation factor RimP [Alphaproteobacteria bacterium]MBE6467431.1 ribosome maturation factor RimP [Alphaproteobacteria bacterium]